jgi:hypothetical protein
VVVAVVLALFQALEGSEVAVALLILLPVDLEGLAVAVEEVL